MPIPTASPNDHDLHITTKPPVPDPCQPCLIDPNTAACRKNWEKCYTTSPASREAPAALALREREIPPIPKEPARTASAPTPTPLIGSRDGSGRPEDTSRRPEVDCPCLFTPPRYCWDGTGGGAPPPRGTVRGETATALQVKRDVHGEVWEDKFGRIQGWGYLRGDTREVLERLGALQWAAVGLQAATLVVLLWIVGSALVAAIRRGRRERRREERKARKEVEVERETV